MDKHYQVYILQNESRKRYIGLSENVNLRLQQHNDGESKWTSKHGPWEMLWTSKAMSLADARKLENQLKRAKGGNGFYQITGLPR
jgi:putative endonuclease